MGDKIVDDRLDRASPTAGLNSEGDENGRRATQACLDPLANVATNGHVLVSELAAESLMFAHDTLESGINYFSQLERHSAITRDGAQDVGLRRLATLDRQAIEASGLGEEAKDSALAFFLFVSGAYRHSPRVKTFMLGAALFSLYSTSSRRESVRVGYQVPVVVGQTKGFGVAEARAAPADATVNIAVAVSLHVPGSSRSGGRLHHLISAVHLALRGTSRNCSHPRVDGAVLH